MVGCLRGILARSRDNDEGAVARFGQEARLLEGLGHVNLVRVDGAAVGVDDEGNRRAFVRMELVEGCGLDVLMAREAPLSEERVAGFGRQLAEGLAYAHGHGIVHRDLKPANVLVADPGGWRLCSRSPTSGWRGRARCRGWGLVR